MSIKDELIQTYKEGNILTKLILINGAVFLVLALIYVTLFLCSSTIDPSYYVSLPAHLGSFYMQPWTIFTYMFVHSNIIHYLCNMLMLYWIGNLFIQFFSERDCLNMYIMGGLAGGVLYLICYTVIPVLESTSFYTNLSGASAAITALAVAVGIYQPEYQVKLALIGDIKLKWVAISIIVLSLVLIPDGNAGGCISHLGGALAGFFFIKQIQKGKNIAEWIGKILDKIQSLFGTKKKWKVAYNKFDTKHSTDGEYNMHRKSQQEELDALLDKVKRVGFANMTQKEKQKLQELSKKQSN